MKILSDVSFLQEAFEAVKRCLIEVPFCKFKLLEGQAKSSGGHICQIGKVRAGGKEVTLLIAVKRSGQPRFVREAINVLVRYRTQFKNSYGIFVAPFISNEASKILETENVGYVDLAGNCRISFDKIYIRKEGNENRFTKRRDLKSLYSPKAERILRALMLEPTRNWKVELLAKTAKVSLGQVSNVKQLLQAREWLRLEKKGFSLAEPKKLLDEWATVYHFQRNAVTEYYSLNSLAEIEDQIATPRVGGRLGVLTGFSAAARLAPAVRYKRISAYVREPSEVIAAKLGWKSVTSGGNVTLIEPYDLGVFLGSREVDGHEIVSPVQAYLDLYSANGRGEEGAEALLREVLQPTW